MRRLTDSIPLAPLRLFMKYNRVTFRYGLQQLLWNGLISKELRPKGEETFDDPSIWSDHAEYRWKNYIKFPRIPILLRFWNDILILVQIRLLIGFLRLFPEPFRYETLNEFFYVSMVSYVLIKVYPSMLADLLSSLSPLFNMAKTAIMTKIVA